MSEETNPMRWQACIHEIGHAAAAMLLGVENIGAVVFAEGGGLATSKPETAIPAKPDDYTPAKLDKDYRFDAWPELLRDATWAAAGQAAVDLILYPERTETNVGSFDDEMLHAAARAAVGLYCDYYAEMYFSAMAAARARRLLKPFLWRVKLAAAELDRRGRLTADEICQAMNPVAGPLLVSTGPCGECSAERTTGAPAPVAQRAF